MLRIVLGSKTEGREATPEVLYVGHDADAMQRALDSAPPEFVKVEFGQMPNLRRAKRNASAPKNSPSLPETEMPPAPAPGSIPPADEPSAGGDGDGAQPAEPQPAEPETDPASEIAEAATTKRRR